MMAFQSSFLRDGEWVTETVDFQAALKASAAPKPVADAHPEPPGCGLLSKTIIESPVVRCVLPVRLRSEKHNDIAFIGDNFVQISELRKDGQVHEVLRKNDFGARIRKAVVFGGAMGNGLDSVYARDKMTKSEESDALMDGDSDVLDAMETRSLPPQLLVVMLETGDCVFLFVRMRPDKSFEFFVTKCESPKKLSYLGYHLAIDPSSRYLAAASPEGVFVIYELESLSTMATQYARHGYIRPVVSIRARAIQGVIHKLEFLFPRPEDDYHIILLLIVVRRDRGRSTPISRMITYEWEIGESLKSTLAEDKTGNRLPNEHRNPMLIIPLRFKNAFFVVSQHYIGVVKNSLSGSPEFELLAADPPGRTRLHQGTDEPLWSAWARPFRLKSYFEKTDIILLAREDGAIIHIEIDAADLVPSVTNVACLDTNIDTAFTSAYDVFSDVLIIGGDSGPGGIWKLAPRRDLERVSVLPNWSPVVDMTTTIESSSWDATIGLDAWPAARPRPATNSLRQPQRVFSASGRGIKGTVTEWRLGIQARIGLDIETEEPLKRSWAFLIKTDGDELLYSILALPHSSIVLQFTKDLGQVNALSSEDTSFDTSSRTLFAIKLAEEIVMQVTEQCIAIVSPSHSSKWLLEDVLDEESATAQHAFGISDVVILMTSNGQKSKLHVLRVEEAEVSQVSHWDIQGEDTCVSSFTVSGKVFAVVGSVFEGLPLISVYSLDGEIIIQKSINNQQASLDDASETRSAIEALTSLCVINQGVLGVDFIAGTRCGRLITARIPLQQPKDASWNIELVGVAPVDVFSAAAPFDGGNIAFMCCDNNLVLLSGYSQEEGKFLRKNSLWLTDSNDPSMASPQIHSVYSLQNSLSEYAGHLSLMVLAGSRLLLADIWPHVGHVPRSIPVEGTPTRIIYSQTWNCIVVALLKDEKPTLAFIDPDSGAIVSVPTDKDRNPVEFISGLGNIGDRIYGLHEWLYIKDGKTFSFMLVTTKDGRLLIISMSRVEVQTENGPVKRIQYWTRYKKGFTKPIYSIVGDAEGLIFCVDRTLHWNILDLVEKKLKPMKEFELDSPATSLRVANGKILALTTMHSVEVIDHRGDEEGEMALIHTDQVSRKTVHMIDVGDSTENPGRWPLTLLSDHTNGIAGVWIPWDQRNKEFVMIFEGRLPASVRRFAFAHSRPLWIVANRRRRYGVLSSTVSGAETLGVSLDGSLQHFTLLGPDLWRFLCLVKNLAEASQTLHPLQDKPETNDDGEVRESQNLEPEARIYSMHIDGDMLERCLKLRVLEELVAASDGFGLFCEYLDSLENGDCTRTFRDANDSEEERRKKYVALGYDVLEYLLAPVL